jgi:hypothetical protein
MRAVAIKLVAQATSDARCKAMTRQHAERPPQLKRRRAGVRGNFVEDSRRPEVAR